MHFDKRRLELLGEAGSDAPDTSDLYFQEEDGIRDLTVTGVQTCALPIWPAAPISRARSSTSRRTRSARGRWAPPAAAEPSTASSRTAAPTEIGRASCRGRAWTGAGYVAFYDAFR